MRAVDAKQVALMKAGAEAYLLDVCGLRVRTDVVTGGVTKPSYATAVNTPCQWLMDEASTEMVDGTVRPITKSRATLLMASTTVINPKDLITFAGRSWNVRLVSPPDELTPTITVKVEEIK